MKLKYITNPIRYSKNQIIGFEALLRWNSPQLGSVPPIKFIKVAENPLYHSTRHLGFKNACKFIYDLREQGYGTIVFRLIYHITIIAKIFAILFLIY